MTDSNSIRTSRVLMPATILLLILLGASGCFGTHEAVKTAVDTGPLPGSDHNMQYDDAWKLVDTLKNDQKYEAASMAVAEIRTKAMKAGDEEPWTRALIEEVQLRTALHGYETAVRFLKDEPWPADPLWRGVLDLYYAQTLVTYFQQYGYEIRNREHVTGDDEVDLKAWTKDQIAGQAHQAFARVWAERESWGERSLGTLAIYIEQNNYPARIRGTLRDAVTYMWAGLMADTSYWRPQQSNELFLLDVAGLIRGDTDETAAADLTDQSIHPLRRLCALLGDLQRWHDGRGQPEAAHEAMLSRLNRLHGALDGEQDRNAILDYLKKVQGEFDQGYPWWSMGQWQLAEFLNGGGSPLGRLVSIAHDAGSPDRLINAWSEATKGRERHPESIGGQRCAHLIAGIETSSFAIEAMAADAPVQRSILVRHKNTERLYFRAWRYDQPRRLGTALLWDKFGQRDTLAQWMQDHPSDLDWTVELPQTGDFRTHKTYVDFPKCDKGAYVVAVSAQEDCPIVINTLSVVHMMVSDLVLVTRERDSGWEICARSGDTGDVRSGVEVFYYDRSHRRHIRDTQKLLVSGKTDADGLFNIDVPLPANGFVFARDGEDIAQCLNLRHGNPRVSRPEKTRSFVYTDRSVYRPGQTLHWKVVAYKKDTDGFRYTTQPLKYATVTLRDGNGKDVASTDVGTNEFGSASGRFVLPTGRLLGQWTLHCSLNGSASIRVEQYKRPTFEVSIPDPEDPLRLNSTTRLIGEASYYFGLPVTTADVVWRVTREPIYPRWWWWRPASSGVQTVASGRTTLDENGRFSVVFTPKADARSNQDRDITYSYRLSVDVTDEGGETRSAERGFRLGFVSVAASIEAGSGFMRAEETSEWTVLRTSLDGVARVGEGVWHLVALKQPSAALLPAEVPVFIDPGVEDPYRTDGDRLTPRWETTVSTAATLGRWEDGRRIASGNLVHGDDGRASVEISNLVPGAYRFHYETEDDFGAICRARREFIVAGRKITAVAMPLLLIPEHHSVSVGDTARLLVRSGLSDQEMVLELFQDGIRFERRILRSGRDAELIELPVGEHLRGGFTVRLTTLRDHQRMQLEEQIFVPWDDRELKIIFETFRDRLRPGTDEIFRVVVSNADGSDNRNLTSAGATELLAYMYDRSLDVFASHRPQAPLALYPTRHRSGRISDSLGRAQQLMYGRGSRSRIPKFPALKEDRLLGLSGYGIGGMGRRYKGVSEGMVMSVSSNQRITQYAVDSVEDAVAKQAGALMRDGQLYVRGGRSGEVSLSIDPVEPTSPVQPRTNFSETAFFAPHLLLDDSGTATIEFKVPDSVTEWNVWVHAITRDLRSGSATKQTASVKELMVRPYLPRFLREGDQAAIKVVVNNAGEEELTGLLDFELIDAETKEDVRADFGLTDKETTGLPFTVEAGGGVDLSFAVKAPAKVGAVICRVTARAGDYTDGEQRPLPILPGRMHLMQSRFASLQDGDHRELRFDDLTADNDPTRIDEQLIVTVDAQLFYSVLNAMPYLVDYPYHCSEQTLNRFLTTGMLTSLFDKYPSVAAMARKLATRETRLEAWESTDPNRKLLLEETPWLIRAEGGGEDDLIKVLDPTIAAATHDMALDQLIKMQSPDGGFPWWPGGRSSPYLTLYILHGFAKGLEFGVEIPRSMVVSAWRYMKLHHYNTKIETALNDKCCWETITFLNYVLSCYPDDRTNWTGGVFSSSDRRRMLDFSFSQWRQHSPLLKGYLALTLNRSDRADDAHLVFDSVMDSAKSDPDLGTYWAPEDRAWLWYNDTIETHAFALRVMTELAPNDARRHGLVQWLLLNKKLNHWSSTRATAEVAYALVHYLELEGGLGVRETATVAVGPRVQEFVFEPDEYTGAHNHMIIPGDEIDPATMGVVSVDKTGEGTAFVSATWHFSTEIMPETADGDLLAVERSWFRRRHDGDKWVLDPLVSGDQIAVGEQLEVQLSVRAKHTAEFVHLRDPRGAGFEPVSTTSGYHWDQGLGYYEEIRDSGANYFFTRLPAGQYTLRYRLRAVMAGEFKVGPAVLQSMYAPEFVGYSAGGVVEVE